MKTHIQNLFTRLGGASCAAWVALALLSTLNSQLSTAHAQGTAFSYQGRLASGGNPANAGIRDQFRLNTFPPAGSTSTPPPPPPAPTTK
jgi:hypothetical protein